MAVKTIFKIFCTTLLTICSIHAFADVQTDHLITQNVKAKIATDPSVSSTNILIKTTDGVVILNGLVDTQEQKDTAFKMAESVQNVLKVESNIAVRSAPEKIDSKTAQTPADNQAATAPGTNTNTQSTDNASTVIQQVTSPNSTNDASRPLAIPPPPPDPNYQPSPNKFGIISNQSH